MGYKIKNELKLQYKQSQQFRSLFKENVTPETFDIIQAMIV